MKTLIIVVVVAAFGLVLGIRDGGQSSAPDDSRIEQGVQRIDSYLAKGLTPATHDTISEKARASADWLKGMEQQALDATR